MQCKLQYIHMFEALLPLLLGFQSISSPPTTTAASVLQSLAIVPPSSIEVEYIAASASGIVIMDAQNGQIVYERNATQTRPMASLTKLMTGLLIAENHDPKELVTITSEATAISGQVANLQVGEQYTVADLLSALLIMSANDAAVALAIHHSGTVPEFVQAMNTRAALLGLAHTSYANPSGLDHPNQYSTPKDIAWLTQYVATQPLLTSRMSRTSATITSESGTITELQHTHALMHKLPDIVSRSQWNVKAGKTGTTYGAKQCLVTLLDGVNRQYIVVLLYSDQRYRDLTNILAVLPQGLPLTLQAAAL